MAGGLCLTFDDDSVEEWFTAQQLLDEFRAKATFFVSRFPHLGTNAVDQLRSLARRGNEISHHTLNHIRITDFLETKGDVDDYLAEEVDQVTESMRSSGLDPWAFWIVSCGVV